MGGMLVRHGRRGRLEKYLKKESFTGAGKPQGSAHPGGSRGAPGPGEAVPDPEVESCPARVLTPLPPPSPLAGLPVVQTQQKPEGTRAQV